MKRVTCWIAVVAAQTGVRRSLVLRLLPPIISAEIHHHGGFAFTAIPEAAKACGYVAIAPPLLFCHGDIGSAKAKDAQTEGNIPGFRYLFFKTE